MAKVTLPLGSLGARGQLGKAFVFFPWKGLHCVRSFVTPANPNTSDQQTQRGIFSDAVDAFHDAAYTAADITGLRLWAAQAASVMTYFNRIVKEYIDRVLDGDTWTNLSNMETSSVATTSFDVSVDVASDKGGDLYIGTSPGYMPTKFDGTFDTDHYDFEVTGLTANTTYYFYIINAGVSAAGRTGIYKQKTAAS